MHPKALAHHQAGLQYQQQGNLRAAAEEYERALAIDARLDLTRMNLAGVLYQLGEYAGAIEHYRQVLDVQPDNLKVVYNLGVAYSAAGQLGDAVSHFLRCLKLDPNFLPALTSLNWIYQQQGNSVGAITVMTQIARLTPEDHATRYQLAVMLKEQQRETEAIARLKELVQDHPGHLAGRLLLADLCAVADPEFAWQQLGEIWSRDQGFVGSRDLGERVARAAIERAAQAGDPKAEASWLERLLKLRTRDPQIIRRLADLYRSLDRTTRAIQLYQELIELRPDDPEPALLVAQCLRRTGKRVEAQAALSRLLQAHPGHTGALLALAELRLDADRADQAEGLLQRALACDPGLVEARILLADVQARLGRDEEAYQSLRSLVSEQPGHHELRKAGAALCRKLATAHQRAATQDSRPGSVAVPGGPGALPGAVAPAGEPAGDHGGQSGDASTELPAAESTGQPGGEPNGPSAGGPTAQPGDAQGRPAASVPGTAGGLDPDATREHAAKRALLWWERYLEFVPEDVKVLELLGALYRQRQAHADAARIYERLAGLKPDPAIWHLLGSCRMAAGDASGAADALQRALDRLPPPAPGTRDESIAIRVSLAEALRDAGRVVESVHAAQEALARDRDHAVAREIARQGSILLAENATAAGNHNEAAARWKYALGLGRDAQALRRYAASLEAAGNLAGAEQAYLELLEYAPDDRAAKQWLGERALATRRPDEARRWFREVLAHDPNHVGAMTALADLAWAAGDRAEAYDLYERLVERDPAHIAGVLTFARDALAASQPLEAWEYVRRILSKHPGHQEATGVAIAALRDLAATAEPAQAVEWYQRLLNLLPEDTGAMRGLWMAYRKLGSVLEAARVAAQILEIDAADAEVALFLADHEQRSGNPERARAVLTPAASAGDPDCLLLLASLEKEAGNWPAVRECLRRVLGFRPKHPAALVGLAEADLAEGRYPEAWGHLEEMVYSGEAGHEALAIATAAAREVGKARQVAGNLQEAVGWFKRALQATPADEESLRALFALQRQLASPEAAAQVARGILARTPGDRDAALFLASFLAERGQGAEAADILAPIKEDPDAAYLLARIAWEAGDVSRTRVHLAEVRRQVPRHLDAARLMARVAKAEASWEEAWNALHEVLALDPENREAVQALPELCRDAAVALAGKPDLAAHWLRRLVQLEPDDLDARADLAAMLSRAGLHGEAADAYRELGERSPRDPRWPTLEGDELRLAGRLQEAEAALRRARALAPEDPATALSMAQLAELTDRPEEAFAAASEALRLVPDDGEARRLALHAALRLAERARIQGDMAGVARRLEDAARLEPEDPQLWRGLGEARRLAGDGLGAAAAFARLWELRPDDLDAAFLAAELFRAADDLKTARQLYLGILERDAGHRPTLLTLARLLWQEDDRNGARWYLGRILAELDREGAPEGESGPRPAGQARGAGKESDVGLRRKVLSMLAAIAWQDGAFEESFDRAGQAMALCERDSQEFKQARGLRLRAAQKLASLADHEGNAAMARKWWLEVSKLDSSDRAAFRRLADLAMEAGEAEEATRMFRVLWETDATDADAALKLAAGLMALGRREEARKAYEEAAARTNSPDAAVALARMAKEDGDPEAAWRWAEAALGHRELETDPSRSSASEAREIAADAALALALRAQDAGNREQESLWWNRLADLDPTGRDRLLPLARGQARSGDLAAAAGTLLRLWEEDPTDATVARELADTLLAAGDLEGALLNYRRVADLTENRLDAATQREETLLILARLCAEHGRAEEAWEWSQALLAQQPDHVEARDIAAGCALDLATQAEAEQDFDSALLYRQVYLALRPGDRLGSLKLAGLHLAAGRREQAVALYQDLLGRHPDDGEVRLCLADALLPDQPHTARQHYEDVLEAEPRNLHALSSLAELTEQAGELELAFALQGRAAEVADDPVPHLLKQAYLAWRLDRLEDAWKRVQEVLGRVPSHPAAVELGASCCRRLAYGAQDRGDLKLARSYWENLLGIQPEDLEAIREVGRIARETGDLEAAESWFSRAKALDPDDKASAYQLGLLQLARKDVTGARRTFASILERDPHHADTLLAMAELAWNDGDAEGAWYHTQELLALEPTNAKGLHLFTELAKTFAERNAAEGDLKTAIQWWTLAHKQDPRDRAVLRRLADAKAKVGDLEGAAEGFGKLLEMDPEDLDAAHVAADIFRQMGNMPRAEAALRRVVELDPRHLPSIRLLMHMARDRGDAKDVMKWAYDLLDHDPQDPDAMFELAWAHNALLEKKAALQTYEELLAQDPHHAESWHEVAQLYRDLGDFEPARKAATNAIVYGARPDFYVTLGTIYGRMGLWDEAIASFGQALDLDPDHPEALAQLGFALLQQRKPDQARPHLERAITLLPRESDKALEVRCALDLI